MSFDICSPKASECENHIENMKTRLLDGLGMLNQLGIEIKNSQGIELLDSLDSIEKFLETLACCSRTMRALTVEVDRYRKALNVVDLASRPPIGRA
jgi:hypothetical protein